MRSGEPLLLKALRCANEERPPVWIMRQAGRYLPEYRAYREKYSLRDLFFTPELAAAITRMPIDLLRLDAAILFSDITVIALSLGLKLDFKEGPLIEPRVTPATRLSLLPAKEALSPIAEAIRIVKSQLSVPLLGFCGGPFTVASYLIGDLPLTKKWMVQEPASFQRLLEKITEATLDYLRLQIEAGVDAVQIFDSWADCLSNEDFLQFCFPYLQRIIQAVTVPIIVFMRGAVFRVDELIRLSPAAISFDWQRPMRELRERVPKSIAVQGNLDPDLLYAPLPVIRARTEQLLTSMEGERGFIVNLGHGLKPDIPVAAVRAFIETVQTLRP